MTAEELTDRLRQAGLTQVALADAARVSPSYISAMADGARPITHEVEVALNSLTRAAITAEHRRAAPLDDAMELRLQGEKSVNR